MDNGALSMALGPLERFPSTIAIKNALKQIKSADKFLALAISELGSGSDVAQIKTTAIKSNDGKYYIVNGNKYWMYVQYIYNIYIYVIYIFIYNIKIK